MPIHTAVLEQDIIKEFENIQVESMDAAVIAKCAALCTQLSLTAEQLAEEWEAFTINQKLDVDNPTCKVLAKFEIFKLKQKQFSKHNAPITTVGVKRKLVKMEESEEEEDEPEQIVENSSKLTILPKRELRQKKEQKKITKTDIEAEKFAKISREKSGTIQNSWNEELLTPEPSTKETNDIDIIITFPYGEQELEKAATKSRYMYDPFQDRIDKREEIALTLNSRLEYDMLAENVVEPDMYDESVKLSILNSIEPFHLFIQSPVVSMARISKEKLKRDDTFHLYLEGSHADAPVRTQLNIDRLKSYSIFPGQVVAVKGSNPNSKLFRLNGLRSPPILPAFSHEKTTSTMRIIAACGPFGMRQNSFNLQPLTFFLEAVKEKRPDILLLTYQNGPFVDERQIEKNIGVIQHHETDYTPEQYFRLQIDTIMEAVAKLDTVVLIVPSQSDIHHPYCVYPQPRFDLNHPELGKRLFFIDDPSTFTLNNQITIGTTSVDILVHIAAEEVKRTVVTDKPYDRVAILLEHILQQGSYYPLYPPAEGHCIDSARIHKMQMKKYAPNILIMPSSFPQFIKLVGETLCINPGRVSRSSLGSYADIVVLPSPEGKQKPFSNTKVTIFNI